MVYRFVGLAVDEDVLVVVKALFLSIFRACVVFMSIVVSGAALVF